MPSPVKGDVMGRLKTLALAGVARARARRVAGCGGDGEPAATTLVFGSAADPIVLDGALVSDGESIRVALPDDGEASSTLEPGGSAVDPVTRDRLDDERRRPRVDVQAPRGRDVPRRRAVQRRGRLLQLRPLVQLPGRAPGRRRRPTTGSTVFGAASRIRPKGARARREPLQELRGGRRPDGDAST